MKTFINIHLTLALLVAPAFAGNDKNYTYLALGDSIPFGMDATLLPPYAPHLPTSADQFTGYPEIVAAAEHLLQSKKEVNASCPGETSGSFLDTTIPDNGCNSPHFQPPFETIAPFKDLHLLHTDYTRPQSQMNFAETQFEANKHIDLVTLNIGANDVLLVLADLEKCGTNAACADSVLAPVLYNYAKNLGTILTRIRAHYKGTLVLMTYYSPTPRLDGVTMAVNGVMTGVAAQLAQNQPGFVPVKIADGFTAFHAVSALFNDDACQAGLLIQLPAPPNTPPSCDIHPSPRGRDLLAATVELAIHAQH